ncbi:MAG: SH3 domain-containing protein [Desulfobacterales bacterium]
MKCVKFIFFSMVFITATMFGPTGFAQQEDSQRESSASAAKADVPASHTGKTVNDSEIKEIPASAESENANRAEAVSPEETQAPESGDEKNTAVSPEKSHAPEDAEKKETAVSPEKSHAPEDAEEKETAVSPEKSHAPEDAEEKETAVSPEKSHAPEDAEEKETAVSPEKSHAPESGDEKNTLVSEDKTDTSEDKKFQESPVSSKTLSVQVNKANVRKDASLGAKINAQLKKGQAVRVIEVKDEWYHIQLDDGEHGWVHGSTLGEKTLREKDISPAGRIALTANGNIRKSPDLASEILAVVKKGEKVLIKESGEEWYQVQLTDGRDGWAHKKLFAKRTPAPVHKMEGIRIEKGEENEEKVYFLYKGPKPPNIFFIKAGSPRIVCDFSNTRPGKGIGQKTEVKGNLIQTVRTGLHGEYLSDFRVVFDVVPGSEYELEHFFAKKEMYLLIVKKQ